MASKKESNSTGEENVTTPKGKYQSGNGGQVFGSRMEDKFLNARKSSAEEKDTKPKLYGSINESSGFGRLMAKSSLDMAVKHMQDNKQESAKFRQNTAGNDQQTQAALQVQRLMMVGLVGNNIDELVERCNKVLELNYTFSTYLSIIAVAHNKLF